MNKGIVRLQCLGPGSKPGFYRLHSGYYISGWLVGLDFFGSWAKKKTPGKLVDGLAGEKVRWTESLGKFDAQLLGQQCPSVGMGRQPLSRLSRMRPFSSVLALCNPPRLGNPTDGECVLSICISLRNL